MFKNLRLGGLRFYTNKPNTLNTLNTDIKIVSTNNQTAIHALNRYILDWKIFNQDCMKSVFTERLTLKCKTEICYDYDTESLIIPHLPSSMESAGEADYKGTDFWYQTKKSIIFVDLWLIPPSVIAILLKTDSTLVTYKRIKVFLS